jgi:putative membrane protein
MKTNSHLPAAAVLLIAALSTSLVAQTEALPNTPTPAADKTAADAPAPRQSGFRNQNDNKLSRADRNFFEEAAKSGMKEVEVSNAVKARLTNAQVRAFAEMMVSDHSMANTELQTLAAAKGVTLPADKKDHGEKWTRKDTKDNELDKDYVEAMEDDHEEAVKLFEKAAKSEDAEIAAFAQKTLPKLQHHLDQVRTLKSVVK